MSREQMRHLALSGTVTFPATYPRVAELHLRRITDLPVYNATSEPEKTEFLVAVEQQSAHTTMIRSLRVSDVRAVFLPHNVDRVDHQDGVWLLGPEVGPGLRIHLNNLLQTRGGCISGIVYVAETTATLLEVRCGLTAGESVQYYPPLPMDRSVNHYDPHRTQTASAASEQAFSDGMKQYPETRPPIACEDRPSEYRKPLAACDQGVAQQPVVFCEDQPLGKPQMRTLGRRQAFCEDRPSESGPDQSQREWDFYPTPYPSEGE